MNKRARLLLLLHLLLLAVLSAGGAGALVMGDHEDPAPTAGDTSEGDIPPLLGGAPRTPEGLVRQQPPTSQPGTLAQSSPDAPIISVWYGATQPFGQKGDPQKWVNILGNVSSVTPIASVTYTLNGAAPVPVPLGPDNFRLALSGDFNIELDYTDLLPGLNQVVIKATDTASASTQFAVTVDYKGGALWTAPQNVTVNWSTAARIGDVAQIVDGNWTIDNGTVRPVVLDFDRLIGIGDLSWRDYTVSVPVTILAVDSGGYAAPSNGPAVGVMVRWQGHYEDPARVGESPRTGWRRLGALGWYRWKLKQGVYSEGLQFLGHRGELVGENARTLNLNTPYIFKVSVLSDTLPNPIYRFKVWQASQSEPAAWDFEGAGSSKDPRSGGVLLVAHHVDARFGNVTVNLNSIEPRPELTLTAVGTGSGEILADPDKTAYRFGEDVILTAQPDAGSVFTAWSGDLTGSANPGIVEMFGDRAVLAEFRPGGPQAPISDDMSACQLQSPPWTYINPLGDATLLMTGSQAQITVPAGTAHDPWTGGLNAPRIMQSVANGDFEVDVKFDSALSLKNQSQGVLVEGDAQNFLRFNFGHDGNTYRIQAYTLVNGTPATRANQAITTAAPMYLRVKRLGDAWTLSYSGDGTNWTQAASFTHSLSVDAVGAFVGNAGKNPLTVGQIDYFFNTANPIVPEDSSRRLNITTTGSGVVERNPLKENYGCGEQVTLTAVPAEGFVFDSWSGDLTGNANPATLVINATRNITAKFVPEFQGWTLTTTPNGNGAVTRSPDKPGYLNGEVVTLTAVPGANASFIGWSGDLSGKTNPVNLVMNANKTVTATFADNIYTLTLTPDPNGTVTPNPAKPLYYGGEQVTLTPVPAAGYRFSGWTGDLGGANVPGLLVMTRNSTVGARFVPQTASFGLYLPAVIR